MLTIVGFSEGDLLKRLGGYLVVLHSLLLEEQLTQTPHSLTFDPKNDFQGILHLRHHSLCQVIPYPGGMDKSNTNPTGSRVSSDLNMDEYIIPLKGDWSSIGEPAELKPGKPAAGSQHDEHGLAQQGGAGGDPQAWVHRRGRLLQHHL